MTGASPCSPHAFERSNYIVCIFDLRVYSLRLFWKDENGQPYGSFEHLPHKLNGVPIAFAMNAGMYESDLSSDWALHREAEQGILYCKQRKTRTAKT